MSSIWWRKILGLAMAGAGKVMELLFSEDFDWKDEFGFYKKFGEDFDWKSPPHLFPIWYENFSGWPE